MPTELEELLEFLHHGNTQIRRIAVENLVGYSKTQPSIFKSRGSEPIKDLRLLIRDYPDIAKNVLTILINISNDPEILPILVSDNEFLHSILNRITSPKEPNSDGLAMLLANMAKSDDMQKLINITRVVPKELSTSSNVMDQLLDCFVKGADGRYNKDANFDYLAYFFADMGRSAKGRDYFSTPQPHDSNIIPLTKLIVFTEHSSAVRRQGVASTMKNVAFDISCHQRLLLPSSREGANVLPYLLLPLMGSEEYSEEDMEGMLDDLQLLAPDKQREQNNEILKTHLETLLLLTTTSQARQLLRGVKLYPIIRETHLQVEDEGVRELCDRIVQVIMRDGATEPGHVEQATDEKEDDDMKITKIL